MNKKLIALAVAGASIAPAVAMAQASPVTLYGRVYETIESLQADAGPNPATSPEINRRTRVSDQASLLGVRGTEDLGGGLKAFFQLETGFKPDQNDTTFAARNSGVGLQGGWGSVLVGRWDMPYKVSTYPVDAFGDLTMAGISGVGHDQGNFDRRDQNVLQYWSPSWGGFAFKAAWTANEGRTCTTDAATLQTQCNNPYDIGANVTYTHGHIYAFYAYEEHKDPRAGFNKENGNSLGGAVTFGPIKVGAEYERIKRYTSLEGGNPQDRKEWLANVVWTFGSNQLIYQHQNSDGSSSSGVAESADCKSDTIAYKYIFSKRTFFIAEYMKTKNEDKATCGYATTAPFALKPGNDLQGAAIGLQHVF